MAQPNMAPIDPNVGLAQGNLLTNPNQNGAIIPPLGVQSQNQGQGQGQNPIIPPLGANQNQQNQQNQPNQQNQDIFNQVGNEGDVILTVTVTESTAKEAMTSTVVEATKTVYLIPTGDQAAFLQNGVDGSGLQKNGLQPKEHQKNIVITETETETETVVITETMPCTEQPTAAPMTVTVPITITKKRTKVEIHWKTVPVEIMHYRTMTVTSTAHPLIADLLPKVDLVTPAPVTKTVFKDNAPMAAAAGMQPTLTELPDNSGYQPIKLPPAQVPNAGQMARNLEYQVPDQTTPTKTETKTIVQTITPPVDWKEAKPAVLNACDLCRQQCPDLNKANCCLVECAGQPPAGGLVMPPMMPPVPPLNPDAIPCDDDLMK